MEQVMKSDAEDRSGDNNTCSEGAAPLRIDPPDKKAQLASLDRTAHSDSEDQASDDESIDGTDSESEAEDEIRYDFNKSDPDFLPLPDGTPDPGRGQSYGQIGQKVILDLLEMPYKKAYWRIIQCKPKEENAKGKNGYAKITKGIGPRLSPANLEFLSTAEKQVPRYQARIYSIAGTGCTSGFSSPELFLPNSHRQKIKTYPNLNDMAVSDIGVVLGSHLCWLRRCEDEFLSWTSSLLFLFSHAILRHEKGQKHIIIAFGDIYKLQRIDGSKPPMHKALDLMRVAPATLPYRRSDISATLPYRPSDISARKLEHRHYTHETLTFGEMRDPGHAVIHVPFEDLVSNGLFELIPELVIPGLLERSGLYQHRVYLTQELFFHKRDPRCISEKELTLCERLSNLFKPAQQQSAPFWIFVKFLAIRPRPVRNPIFCDWVTKHYSALDITAGCYDKMEQVADNLPDVAQTIALAHEAADALGLRLSQVSQVVCGQYLRGQPYRGQERFFKAFRTRELDKLSEYLIQNQIYGTDGPCRQARRDLAQVTPVMAESLKLREIDGDDAHDLGALASRTELDGIATSDASYIVEVTGVIWKKGVLVKSSKACKKKLDGYDKLSLVNHAKLFPTARRCELLITKTMKRLEKDSAEQVIGSQNGKVNVAGSQSDKSIASAASHCHRAIADSLENDEYVQANREENSKKRQPAQGASNSADQGNKSGSLSRGDEAPQVLRISNRLSRRLVNREKSRSVLAKCHQRFLAQEGSKQAEACIDDSAK